MSNTCSQIVEVALPLPLQTGYSYRVPQQLAAGMAVGKRVLVPLGCRQVTGYVIGFPETAPEQELKSVLAVLDEEPLFTERDLALYRWAAAYYYYPLGLTIQTALPPGLNEQYRPAYRLTERGRTDPPAGGPALLDLLAKGAPLGLQELEKQAGRPSLKAAVERLVKSGHLERVFQKRGGTVAIRKEKWYSPTGAEPAKPLKGRQLEVFACIAGAGCVAHARLRERFGACTAQLKALSDKKLIACEAREVYRHPVPEGPTLHEPVHRLNAEQRAATDSMLAALADRRFQSFLLHGVTGSGKTEVYLQLMQHVLERGRQCLFMVPEISLTVQLWDRISSRLQAPIAMLHSSLTPAERFDAWRMIRRGEIKIVIGARSAVFASFADLGVIVVDEEHDASYKQDDKMRYNGRDLAVVKAQHGSCTVVLGSATPSLESYFNAQHNKYRLQTLSMRAADRSMPQVRIVDMKGEPAHRKKKAGVLSGVLLEALQKRLDAGEQSMLFLNRRGFSPALICQQCGHTFSCPNCDVSLIQHRRRNKLACHYCDHTMAVPQECSACGSYFLAPLGWGTERLEDDLARLLPGARVSRLDRDTAASGRGARGILKDMEAGAIDVLIGTQMIAKGFHLPGVTLVGVISADQTLSFPDYRAGERSFQLLTQVAGRAGRGSGAGEVIIQTYNPEHYSVRCAQQHDFKAFYRQELSFRQALTYPPVGRIINLRCEGTERQQVAAFAKALGDSAERLKGSGRAVSVLGPAQSPWEKLNNKYRFQLLLKSADGQALRAFCSRLLGAAAGRQPRDVRLIVDVDPLFLM